MPTSDYYIVPEDKGWRVRFLLEDGPYTPKTKLFASRYQALAAALDVARTDLHFDQNVRVHIQQPDGSYRTEWSGTHME